MIVGHQHKDESGELEPCGCVVNVVGKRRVLGALCLAIALLWSSATKAETRVYLLRGWFGVFSTGLDSLAAELRSKGIKAETVGHLAWKTTVSNIIKWHASGSSGPLVLVGHSQGANNVIDMARLLQRENIPVDLLVTLAPAGAGPDSGQCGAGHQLLQFTGLGRARNRGCGLSWQADEHQSRWRHRPLSYGHRQESQDPGRN